MNAVANRKLGKGLSALMAEDYSNNKPSAPSAPEAKNPAGGLMNLSVKDLIAGRFQPRTRFTDEQLKELSESIARSGVMQPIIVRPHPEQKGKFEIIAGERRWRASQLAKQTTIPALVRELDDKDALELALVENVQRQDLTAMEEAYGYQRLMDEFSYTQEELSATLGKSRSHIANMLRLLSLPKSIREKLEEGTLTPGHARALVKAEKPEELAEEIVRRGLNVRQAENLARAGLPQIERKPRPSAAARAPEAMPAAAPVIAGQSQAGGYTKPKDPDVIALEETLCENLGLKVSINEYDGGQRGEVVLSYETLHQLDDILRRLGGAF